MRLDILLQIVVFLEAYLYIVHTAGSQDKHQDHTTKHNGQKSVLDGKLTSHVENRFRKIEKHDAFEQKESHSDLDEESYQDETDKNGGSPFEFEKSDKSLIDQMKLLEQKLTSKPEWKEKYVMDAKSEAPEGIDERLFEHSEDNPKADSSKIVSTVSPREHSKREMDNTGNNEHEVDGDAYSKSEMANDNINAKLFHYLIDGECDEHDDACSNKEDKAFSEESDKVVTNTPVDKYKKENQDLNNLEKDRETQLEKLDEMYKLKRQDASVSTDLESFVDKTDGSLIEQLHILEQKIKQQDDWKRLYDKAEHVNDYEIEKESQTPAQSIFIVAERTQRSLLGQMKELETKIQQENQKHSDVVCEDMLVKNELGMGDANSGESNESIDEKDLNPSPIAYFSKEGSDFMSESSFVHKMGNEDEKEKLTHSVFIEDNFPGSLIEQMKFLEQKIKSDDNWKREYGMENNFEDALREMESKKLNDELEDNLLVIKTSSHDGHINVETPADKYKREYQNTFHEELHFIEERGGSLIDQMKKLEQKIKTKEDWNEVHDKDSIHYENRREQSEIVISIQGADGTSATGQNSVNLVGHERDGGHYFPPKKRQKCFQTKEFGIPQIDTVERVIDQVIAYEQQEMDRAKPDKEFSSVDFGEHMDDVGKSLSMHDQAAYSIPQTEAPVSDVTPSKTAVINNTGQSISFLQMSHGTLAESTILKIGTKTVIERSTFMNKNSESSTTQIWFHSIPMKYNQLDSMANIGDNHQPTTKYQAKSESLDVDVIYAEKDTYITTEDADNVDTKNHGFPSNVFNEDNPKILSTDNSKATQVKTFCHRPYGPSRTRTELNTIPETDEDKNSMTISVGVKPKMPACASMHTTETIAGMHTKHTNAEVSTKQTTVNMNIMQTHTDMLTLQAGLNGNTKQTSVDMNTRKNAKNCMQLPTNSKDNNAGMNTVQMGSQVTTLPDIDSSFSLQIHMQVEPSVSLWYAGTADNERVSQHKEQIEQSTQKYAVNIPVIVLSSLVQDHMTSISDHLSLTSTNSVSTLEISTSHELPWEPGQAKLQSWGNKYSYFNNDALYQSTSESHQMIVSISHTGYSDRNTRVR